MQSIFSPIPLLIISVALSTGCWKRLFLTEIDATISDFIQEDKATLESAAAKLRRTKFSATQIIQHFEGNKSKFPGVLSEYLARYEPGYVQEILQNKPRSPEFFHLLAYTELITMNQVILTNIIETGKDPAVSTLPRWQCLMIIDKSFRARGKSKGLAEFILTNWNQLLKYDIGLDKKWAGEEFSRHLYEMQILNELIKHPANLDEETLADIEKALRTDQSPTLRTLKERLTKPD